MMIKKSMSLVLALCIAIASVVSAGMISYAADPPVKLTPDRVWASESVEGANIHSVPTGIAQLTDGNGTFTASLYNSRTESAGLNNPTLNTDIVFHFEKGAEISAVKLYRGYSVPTDFTIYTSQDSGVTWSAAPVHTETGNDWIAAGTLECTFTAVKVNAIKINVTAVTAWLDDSNGYAPCYFVSLGEMEVYGVAAAAAPEVAVSSVIAPTFDGGVDNGSGGTIPTGIEFLTDGDTDPGNGMYYNRAPDAGSALNDVSANIIMKLDSNVDVSKITLYQGRSNPKTFRIYTSKDQGITWSTAPVYEVIDGTWTSASCSILLNDVPANAIKINVTSVSGWDNWYAFIYFLSLAEIDVFGTASSADFPPPAAVPEKISFEAESANSHEGTTELDGAIPTGLQYLSDGSTNGGDGMYYSAKESAAPTGAAQQADLANPIELFMYLDESADISEIVLYQGRTYPTSFTLYTSADGGVTWDEADKKENFNWLGGSYTSAFAARPANAVKLKVTSVFGWGMGTGFYHFVSLAEAEIYGVALGYDLPARPAPPPPPVKIPFEKVDASSSWEDGSVSDGGTGTIPIGKKYLTDGDLNPNNGMYYSVPEDSARGTTRLARPVELAFHMSKSAEVSSVTIYCGRTSPRDFAVHVSADGGKTWTLVDSQMDSPAWTGPYTSTFAAQPANVIKVTVTKVNHWNDGFSDYHFVNLTEVEAYGVPMAEELPKYDPPKPVEYNYTRIDMRGYLKDLDPGAWPGAPQSYNSWDSRSELMQISNSLERCDYEPRYSKAFLIDGKIEFNSDSWSSYAMGPDGNIVPRPSNYVDDTVILKLPGVSTVGQIGLGAKLQNSANFPRDFELFVSRDGQNWTEVLTVNDYIVDNAQSEQLFQFTPRAAGFVKLHVTNVYETAADPAAGFAVSLSELSVFSATGGPGTGEKPRSPWPTVTIVLSGAILAAVGLYERKRRRAA